MIDLVTISSLKNGMTREEVIATIGEPDDMAMTNRYQRKTNRPSIFKYGDLELWFEAEDNGKLVQLWDSKIHKIIDWR